MLGLEPFLSFEQTAVIKETLRLATTTPAGLPRVVPPSGAVISGVWIPGGVCAVFRVLPIPDCIYRQL